MLVIRLWGMVSPVLPAARRPAVPWSSRPISSRRTDTVAVSPSPTPAASPGGIEPVLPGSAGAGMTPQQAGNLVRNLETPRYGVDAYVQARIAEGAGTRQLKGGSRKGFVYTAGPYKGLTEGQAMERARREYATMSPQQRAGYEQRAQGNDVMSPAEQARTNQNYAARGVAAMAAGGMPIVGQPMATTAGNSTPTPAPAAPVAPIALQGPPERMSLGTINGRPVMDIRAERQQRLQSQQGVQPVPPTSPSRSAAQQAIDAYNVMQSTQGPPKKLANPPGEKARLQYKADYYQGPPKDLQSPEKIYTAPSTGEKMIAQAGVQPVPPMAPSAPSPTPPAAPKASKAIEPVLPMAKAKAMGESATFKGAIEKPSPFAATETALGIPQGSVAKLERSMQAATDTMVGKAKDMAAGAAEGYATTFNTVADAAKSAVRGVKSFGDAMVDGVTTPVRKAAEIGGALAEDIKKFRAR